eukprot:gene7420-11743_t
MEGVVEEKIDSPKNETDSNPFEEDDHTEINPETEEDDENQFFVQDEASDSNVHESTLIEPAQPEKKYWNIILVVVSTFFLTVATVLGTGILALPVKLEKSGFYPFLSTFSVGIVAQCLVIIYMVELLQKTQAIMDSETPSSSTQFIEKGPDLHSMGKYFLNIVFQWIFDTCVILHFVSILISYSLAGPEAYSQFFELIFHYKIPPVILIPCFVIVIVCIVVFASKLVATVITGLTFFKGSMLILMIGVVGFVGFEVNVQFVDNWVFTGKPFLVGTVAIGGAINTLPIIYSKMKPTFRNINLFRLASVLGLIVCWLLNIFWCLFILKIVPQTAEGKNASLHSASEAGQPSTVPLVEILNTQHPQFIWVGYLVAIFIMISITVSFIAMSSGLKHMLDGYVKAFLSSSENEGSIPNRIVSKFKHSGLFLQFGLYGIFYTIITIIGMLNPKGFLVILETFTSLALNLESGFFIAYMVWTSKKVDKEIPAPLPKWFVYVTVLFTAGYFLSSVIYDIGYSIASLFVKDMPF